MMLSLFRAFPSSPLRSFSRPLSVSNPLRLAPNQDQEKTKEDQDQTHYDLLGLTPDATQTEIREAFFKKAKQFHPDVNPSKEATEHFLKIRAVYNILRVPEKRDAYDRTIDLEESAEQRGEKVEKYWMARHLTKMARRPGRRHMWSEKLIKDYMNAPNIRSIRRRGPAAVHRVKPLTIRQETELEASKPEREYAESHMYHAVGETPEGSNEWAKRLAPVLGITGLLIVGYLATVSEEEWKHSERTDRRREFDLRLGIPKG